MNGLRGDGIHDLSGPGSAACIHTLRPGWLIWNKETIFFFGLGGSDNGPGITKRELAGVKRLGAHRVV